MVEAHMYFAIGFLLAALGILIVAPLVHGRAVRLTRQRLESMIPASAAEIMADKDLLRAEFALSTRQLEIALSELRAKSANERAELGRKTDAVHRLANELTALRAKLNPLAENIARDSRRNEATALLPDQDAELTTMPEARAAVPAPTIAQAEELVALRAQVESLSKWLTDAGAEIRDMRADKIELEAARQALAEERSKFRKFHRRAAELVEQLIKQAANDQYSIAADRNSDASIEGRSALSSQHSLVERPAA